jgi:hypothetical protein
VYAERWEVSAQVPIPDSIADASRAWTRVTGTTTLADGFRLPWLTPHATVHRTNLRAFTVRGSVYHLIDARLCDTTLVAGALRADRAARWLPGPPAAMTFAVTILGPGREPDGARPVRSAVLLTPNPARGPVVLTGQSGERVEVFDGAGRRVLARTLSTARFTWDPRDANGRPLPAGIYFVRAPGRETARLVLMR